MSARDTLIGILGQWAERHGGATETPDAVVDAYRAEVRAETRREIAAFLRAEKVREPEGETEEHLNCCLDDLARDIEKGERR